MMSRCIARRLPFGAVLLKTGREEDGHHMVGTVARISSCEPVSESDSGPHLQIEVKGDTRFNILETFQDDGCVTARVKLFWEETSDPLQVQPLFDSVNALFRSYVSALFAGQNRHVGTLYLPHDPTLLSFAVASALNASVDEKQKLLEMTSTARRLAREVELLTSEENVREGFEQIYRVLTDNSQPIASTSGDSARPTVTPLDPASLSRFLSRN
jgi:Lon protease-like protein